MTDAQTELTARVIALYQAGQSLRQVAATVGIGGTTVLGLLIENDVPRRPNVPKIITPQMAQQICDLYASGQSLRQIAAVIGVSAPSVRGAMIRKGIARRPRAEAVPSGPDHPFWCGDQAGYHAAHGRVRKARGKPQRCEECGTTDPGIRYEWANLTG